VVLVLHAIAAAFAYQQTLMRYHESSTSMMEQRLLSWHCLAGTALQICMLSAA
jgi:hypothetical protein